MLGTSSSACAIAFTPIGARAAAEQAEDGDGAGDGGDGANGHGCLYTTINSSVQQRSGWSNFARA